MTAAVPIAVAMGAVGTPLTLRAAVAFSILAPLLPHLSAAHVVAVRSNPSLKALL